MKKVIKKIKEDGGYASVLPRSRLYEILCKEEEKERESLIRDSLRGLSVTNIFNKFGDLPGFCSLHIRSGRLDVGLRAALVEKICEEVEYYLDLFDI